MLGLRILLIALLVQVSAPVAAAWKIAETQYFRLFSKQDNGDLTDTAHSLERFHQLLVSSTGRTLPANASKLDIFLVDKIADTRPWSQSDHRVGGYYRTSINRIAAFATLPSSASPAANTSLQILFHEYAHHFLMGAGGAAYPGWYQEGLAEYYGAAIFAQGKIELGRIPPERAELLRSRKWLPLERVLLQDVPGGSQEFLMFYAQSWLMTHYFLHEPSMREKLVNYLRASGQGVSPVHAFQQHVTDDFKRFNKDLQDYTRRLHFVRMPMPNTQIAPVLITNLGAGADHFLLPVVALEFGGNVLDAKTILADVQTNAAKLAPEDAKTPLVQMALALASYRAGHLEEAAQILNGLITRYPQEAVFYKWQAVILMKDPDKHVEVRRLLQKGLAVAPHDWQLLYHSAQMSLSSSGRLEGEALEDMLRAYELAPQVAQVAMNAAVGLVLANRMEEAANVLQGTAWSPHSSQVSRLARNLMEAAKSGNKQAFLNLLTRQATASAGAH